MPVLQDRDAIEAAMATEVGKLNARTRRKLLKLIGDPPKLDNFTDDVWREILIDYQQVLTPQLESVFIAGVENMVRETGFSGVSFDLINERAALWAREYSGTLSGQLIDTRRNSVGQAVADYYENKIDRQGMIDRVSRLYGPAHSEAIAVTEVTRAAVQGEKLVVNELTDQGVMMRKVWLTVRDKKVCPICEPLDGVQASNFGFDAHFAHPVSGIGYYAPPAHMRCRCGIRYEYENEILNNG